jgi:hypothetical protein
MCRWSRSLRNFSRKRSRTASCHHRSRRSAGADGWGTESPCDADQSVPTQSRSERIGTWMMPGGVIRSAMVIGPAGVAGAGGLTALAGAAPEVGGTGGTGGVAACTVGGRNSGCRRERRRGATGRGGDRSRRSRRGSSQWRAPFQLGSAARQPLDRELATGVLGAPTQVGQAAAGDVGGNPPPVVNNIDA